MPADVGAAGGVVGAVRYFEVETTVKLIVIGEDGPDAVAAVEDAFLGHDLPHIIGVVGKPQFSSARQIEWEGSTQ